MAQEPWHGGLIQSSKGFRAASRACREASNPALDTNISKIVIFQNLGHDRKLTMKGIRFLYSRGFMYTTNIYKKGKK